MPKRILEGVIVSDKMDKTIVVKVERRVHAPDLQEVHPQVEEVPRARRSQRLQGQDCDIVRIRECRPLSKTKSWEVLVEGAKA
jgi:small subunit ribosomal protein S17